MPGKGSDLSNAINKAEGLLRKRPKSGSPLRRRWGQSLAHYVDIIAASTMSDTQLFTHIQSPKLWDIVQHERGVRNARASGVVMQ